MEERITGVMIYYYFVCKRKLWYFCHEIRMEAENEDVILGKILDESSYRKNDKHINIDNIINIDFISERKELHEIKKSKAVEEAGIWQVKYYLYYLWKRGVKEIKGKVDYPLLNNCASHSRYFSDELDAQIFYSKKEHMFTSGTICAKI